MYQWENIEDAKAFYSGPWLDGIVERYGMNPQIELYEVFCGDRQLARQGRTLQGNCCRKIAPGGDSSIDLVLALFRVKGPYWPRLEDKPTFQPPSRNVVFDRKRHFSQ